jgi:hypothetical protein
MKAAMADSKSSARTKMVHERMRELTAAGGDPHEALDLDWDLEVSAFKDLPYPDYYRQPFHSVPNGWLSSRAATKNRVAMQVNPNIHNVLFVYPDSTPLHGAHAHTHTHAPAHAFFFLHLPPLRPFHVSSFSCRPFHVPSFPPR